MKWHHTAAIAIGMFLLIMITMEVTANTRKIDHVRKESGCQMMAQVARSRSDTITVIAYCTEWGVVHPFNIGRKP